MFKGSGSEIMAWGLGFRDYSSRHEGLRIRNEGLELRVRGLGMREREGMGWHKSYTCRIRGT